ncbi:MAG: hypothetical protein GX574_17490 [Lentisphaerae bacterium]|mgnify:FL=1|nr:hypothetical protein [Lentisphaerota bacterium]HQL88068.1 hypothetical protein [Lentisphaeria bacterium]
MLILVTDAHIRDNTAAAADFLAMLERIADSQHDVVFLGDIVDLWVALQNFPNAFGQDLLDWCCQQKERRFVAYLEGNHEFFVHRHHGEDFSRSSELALAWGDCVFMHGDRIHIVSLLTAFILWLAKSWLGYTAMRWTPGAPAITAWMKSKLSSEARGIADNLPEEAVRPWAEREDRRYPGRQVFVGHFHVPAEWAFASGGAFRVVPAWKNGQLIGLFDPETGAYQTGSWRELLG